MDTTNLKSRLDGKLQARKPEPTERIINMPNTATALTTINNSNYIALKSDALSIISENLKNQQLTHALFDVIKSPAGGITSFSVPGISGDTMEKELTGIILDYTTPRAYWDTPDPVEGTPPVCFSMDSHASYVEGKPCARCVFNDFGSKDGESNAKACKESVEVYLLRPDSIMPVIVRIPVSSKLLFLKYSMRLIGSMTPIYGVVTRITLDKATSKAGKPYALYNFEAVSVLSTEEAATARAFGQKFMEILNAADETIIKEVV